MTAENYCLKRQKGVRKLMAERLNRQADVFAIDSMPFEICKLSRECKEIKWAKNRNIIAPIKVTAHHRKNIFMDINYTVFVQLPALLNH